MKRSKLDQTSYETLTFPTFQTDLDWKESQRKFEKDAEEFMQQTQLLSKVAKRKMQELEEKYESKTYDEDGWKITEVKSKDGQFIIRMKNKIKDNASIIKIEYINNGQKVYQSEKIEGIYINTNTPNTVAKKDNGGYGCLIEFLRDFCAVGIIILILYGMISLF